MEQLVQFATQIYADESQTRNILKQIETDVLKTADKDQLIALIQSDFNQICAAHDPSSDSQQQLLNLSKHREHLKSVQKQPFIIQLELILISKLSLKLTSAQKFASLIYLFLNHSNSTLHRLSLQLLFKSFTQLETAQSVFICLQYFTLAAQQNSPVYVLICNQIVQYFIQISNFYAAFEFLKRNKSKLQLLSKQSTDQELQCFLYQCALVNAQAGLFEQALQQIRQARVINENDQRVQYLELILKIITLQEVDEIEFEHPFFNTLQNFYLTSNLVYCRTRTTHEQLLNAIQQNKEYLTVERFIGLVKQIASDVFKAKLQVKFYSKIYTEKAVQQIENVNVKDFHSKGSKIVFKEHTSFYDTVKPRQLLLEVLDRRIEAQRLVGLKNVQGEEFDTDEHGQDDEFELDDFMEFYFEGSD
ncbi:Conserved_hypothetical protein [Hexamita inflata]|uniref:PCI domain-containing protein n=1 Tax=Hexamita inflata TaxID=28002 RepID=A0ABP1H6X6_9EUKA